MQCKECGNREFYDAPPIGNQKAAICRRCGYTDTAANHTHVYKQYRAQVDAAEAKGG